MPNYANFWHCITYSTNSLGNEFMAQIAISYDGLVQAVRTKTPTNWTEWKIAYKLT